MSSMTPREIVHELDKFIVGQAEAKRAVAIALRNRWRRQQVDEALRPEITPKNILMIGPTGVGKTEIARRLATLADAPFIKVEATKFTEVGYVGRDVESIIRDLVDVAMKDIKEIAIKEVQAKAELAAVERILDVLIPQPKSNLFSIDGETQEQPEEGAARIKFREKIVNGELDDKEIEIELKAVSVGVEIMAPPGMEEMTEQLQGMFQSMNQGKAKKKKMKISDAKKHLTEEEAARLVSAEDLKAQALESVEQNGIVFIDEIDKVTRKGEHSGGDVSREGVQRDLLPLVEGSTVTTKHGMVKTDHILFIASGAFHLSKPSDLIPELQGRLPIRVELQPLTSGDFERILTEPDAALTIQYKALMKTEGVHLDFLPEGVKKIAEAAWHVNEKTENIGARRLHTVMERLLEDISFTAPDKPGTGIKIDAEFVSDSLDDFAKDEDLSRYIL